MGVTQRIAVADLRTNSTRLLVADLGRGGELIEVDRRTEVTRLGDGVDASGRLADDAIERVLGTLERFRQLADGHGAARSLAVATSAVRDARNGEDFRQRVRERSGFDVRTISGDEEARLTFLGAAAGRQHADSTVATAANRGPDPTLADAANRANPTLATAGRDRADHTLVIDIGGGSTEYVVGRPGEAPSFHVSTRLGSVRQTERHLESDPPAVDELHALAGAAREIISTATPAAVRADVGEGIAVAGTATSLAAIELALEPYGPARVHGHRLTLYATEGMLDGLAAMPVEERREVPGLHPDRAPTIVAGAVILVESMRAFGLESVEASEADILHGAALESGIEG